MLFSHKKSRPSSARPLSSRLSSARRLSRLQSSPSSAGLCLAFKVASHQLVICLAFKVGPRQLVVCLAFEVPPSSEHTKLMTSLIINLLLAVFYRQSLPWEGLNKSRGDPDCSSNCHFTLCLLGRFHRPNSFATRRPLPKSVVSISIHR